MVSKNNIVKKSEREIAIKLRKQGKTYSEILEVVPVAKSTLSLWLRDVGLAKTQKHRITQKIKRTAYLGGKARRVQRMQKSKVILEKAKKDIDKISKRDLWLMGTALYWAEGAKEKAGNTSPSVDFGNSDPKMIRLYIKWLLDILHIAREDICLSLYIHENAKPRIQKIKNKWSLVTGFPSKDILYVYYKKHNPKTKRKNTGKEYIGLLRVRVSRSTDLNRKVMGWVEGVLEKV